MPRHALQFRNLRSAVIEPVCRDNNMGLARNDRKEGRQVLETTAVTARVKNSNDRRTAHRE